MTLVVALAGCRDAPPPGPATDREPPLREAQEEPTGVPSGQDEAPLVVFLGDSLTAGLGLAQEEAFPAQLQSLAVEREVPLRVVNAGVSGDTSAGGRRRLPWLLQQRPDVVVVELGANDGLRGLPLEHTEENLRQIIAEILAAGSRVLLLGMQVPPNYGPEYTRGFSELFPRMAEEFDIPLVPFLLDGVAGRPELNLPDGIHPTAAGHRHMALTVLAYLEDVLRSSPGGSRAEGDAVTKPSQRADGEKTP